MRGVNSTTSASQMMKPMPMIVQPTGQPALSPLEQRDGKDLKHVGSAGGDAIAVTLQRDAAISEYVVISGGRGCGEDQLRIAPDAFAKRRGVRVGKKCGQEPWCCRDDVAAGVRPRER